MTQQSIKNRLGTPYFTDTVTGIQCSLPEGLMIYSFTGRIWIGSSHRSSDLFYMERVTADIQQVPTILADGDIDLNLVSIGRPEDIGAGAEGVVVAGYFRDQSFSGYLALVAVNETHKYLVMVASTQLEEEEHQRRLCLAVTKNIKEIGSLASVRG